MITEKTHPYRVQIADKLVAFPASMSSQAVEAACQRIHDEQKTAPVQQSRPKSLKAGSILGTKTAGATSVRLSQILDGVQNPPSRADLDKALDDAGVPPHDDMAQRMISFRSSKSLPEVKKANIQKLYAAFNNSQVKPKPARKK